MIIITFLQQQGAVQAVDTLSKITDSKWKAADQMSQSPAVIQAMASHDLIFIVLGVTLIIWLILLFFIIRLDRKVNRLEQKRHERDFPEAEKEETL